MPITKDYRILACNNAVRSNKQLIIMTYISEEEEELLDKGKTLILTRGDKTLKVEINKTYCYGEIDFTNGSDDMETIDNFDFLNYLGSFKGIPIHADYNYETHSCCSPVKGLRWSETFHPSVVAQYAHGCLGKPQRVVLFYQLI